MTIIPGKNNRIKGNKNTLLVELHDLHNFMLTGLDQVEKLLIILFEGKKQRLTD